MSGRGIVSMKPAPEGFEFLCDCATLTTVVVRVEDRQGRLVEGPAVVTDQEFAVTCEGCGTSHWITVTGGAS